MTGRETSHSRRAAVRRARILAGAAIVAIALGGVFWKLSGRARVARELSAARAIGAQLPALPLEQLLAQPKSHLGRRARVAGRYDRDRTALWSAERRGVPGARVLTPLHPDPAETWAVWVDRGWIPTEEIEGFRERDGAAATRVLFGVVEPLPAAAGVQDLPYPVLPILFVREPGSGDELPLPLPVARAGSDHDIHQSTGDHDHFARLLGAEVSLYGRTRQRGALDGLAIRVAGDLNFVPPFAIDLDR